MLPGIPLGHAGTRECTVAYLGFCACIFQVRIETYTICLFDSQILFCKKTELRKADHTVGVNYNILSSISSGTA